MNLRGIDEEVGSPLDQSHGDLPCQMSIASGLIWERIEDRERIMIKSHSVPCCRAWLLLVPRIGFKRHIQRELGPANLPFISA